jgi:hypothetical protein
VVAPLLPQLLEVLPVERPLLRRPSQRRRKRVRYTEKFHNSAAY